MQTIVCYDPINRCLVHRPAWDCSLNFLVLLNDQKFELIIINNEGPNSADVSMFAEGALQVRLMDDAERLVLSADDLNGCAELDGRFTFSRTWIGDYEILDMLPLERAYDMQLSTRKRDIRSSALIKVRRGHAIPKIIHQTAKDHDLPRNYLMSSEKLRDRNPDFSFRLWSDKDSHDFIYDNYGYDLLRLYLSINPRYGAARADLFRYLLIYKMGGVYLDIKSSCSLPLAELIRSDDEYLLSYWHRGDAVGRHSELEHIPGGEFQQWHICAAPGHPFLENVIERVIENICTYDEAIHGVGRLGVLRVTGPIAYSLAIHPILKLHPHRFINAEKDGFIYNDAGPSMAVFGSHYSLQDTPVII